MDPSVFLVDNAPKTLKDLVGNRMQKQKIIEFVGGSRKSALIIGPSGSGKTLMCNLVLEQFKCSVIRPNYESHPTHKEFTFFIEQSLKTKTITEIMNKRKKALFLDDIDVLFSQDRFASSYIMKLVEDVNSGKYGDVVLLITCASGEEKRVADLKKKIEVIKITPPPINDSLAYAMQLLDKEGYDVDDQGLLDLVKSMNGNLRNIFLNIAMCVDIEHEGDERAYFDMNIYDIVSTIFKNAHKGFEELEIALSSDPSLISYIMYDNYKTYIPQHYDYSQDAYFDGIMKVMQFYVDSSIMDANVYASYDWNIIEWGNLLKCGSIRALQNTFKKRKSQAQTSQPPVQVQYTNIMTRSSQHFSNLKKIQRYACAHDLDHHNILMISEIAFEKAKEKDKSWKFTSKTDDGLVIIGYGNNICSKDTPIYTKRIRKCK